MPWHRFFTVREADHASEVRSLESPLLHVAAARFIAAAAMPEDAIPEHFTQPSRRQQPRFATLLGVTRRANAACLSAI